MVLEKRSLEGKVAVVTGAAGLLGSCLSQVLAEAGATVAVSDFRAEPLEKVAESVRQLGQKSIALLADITDSRQVDRMIEGAITKFGKIDILVNAAGIVRGGGGERINQAKPIWEITDNEWRTGIDVNLSGAFYCCRAVAKHLLSQKSGKVINFASGYGLRGGEGNFMYCCGKGGIIQLTRVLALTWAQDNIQVNTIVPGFIAATAEGRQAQFIPVGRTGIPSDIASLGLFLASDASNYITGGAFACDGGGLAGGYARTGYAPIINM
ncbi:MAG: SDR family NAD(P)-dependent oxidoreductase [Chloroflexota bacterium]